MKTYVLTISTLAIAVSLIGSSAKAAEDMNEKMMMKDKECMTVVKTGNQDVDFIRNMIPHHQKALEMAEKQLNKGRDAEAKAMAEKMLEAQKKEIADMKSWLRSHQ